MMVLVLVMMSFESFEFNQNSHDLIHEVIKFIEFIHHLRDGIQTSVKVGPYDA